MQQCSGVMKALNRHPGSVVRHVRQSLWAGILLTGVAT